jgi:hypothetical protein
MSELDTYNNGGLNYRDGYDDDSQYESRTIQGQVAKFGADSRWSCQSLPMPDVDLIAIDCRRIIQRWRDGMIVDEFLDPPLPDVSNLNSKIPEAEWEIDQSGKPRPPYSEYKIVYLLNPATAQKFTVINSTVGLNIAYGELTDATRTMRKLRGAAVVPVVRLGSAPMKTKFGMKSRPYFVVVRWVHFGAVGVSAATPKMIEAKAQTSSEIISDEIPF